MRTVAWLAIVVGLALRVASAASHEAPRGDVVLDVGVARSLAAGDGFASGFDRALARVAGPPAPLPRQDLADQHAPLWPLAGALGALVAGGAFGGLKLASLLLGLLLIAVVWRTADRLTEGIAGASESFGPLAAGLVATGFVLVDAAGNGSLYTAQAALVVLLVEALGAARPSPRKAGLVLGLALLLNHQCAALLPLPPLVLVLGAAPGARRRALGVGLAIVAVALALQLPWWVRNAVAFGDPLHSVNGLYFLYRAGVPFGLGLEDGQAVLRFEQTFDPLVAARASLGLLPPNVLYVLTASLFVWPGLGAVVAAGAPSLLRQALVERNRRLLGLLLAALLLGLVAVLWPATKLRYLVSLAPLGVLLGVRLLARLPTRGERRFAWLVALGWLAIVGVTLDDVLGGGERARPARWWTLLGAGLPLVVAPALARARGWRVSPVVLSGLPVAVVLTLVVLLGPGPGTAYHSAPFLDDFFGQPAEVLRERDVVSARWARDVLDRRGAGPVAGPLELLTWGGPLVELPAAGPEALRLCLTTLMEQQRVDHVVLSEPMEDWFEGQLPAEIAGRLELVERRPADDRGGSCTVLAVRP